MVQNPPQARATSDPLSMLVQLDGGPIKLKDLTEDDVSSVLEAARPHGGRRRDGYLMTLKRQWWVNGLYYMGIQNLDVPEVMENIDPGMLMDRGGYVANHVMRLVLGNVARLTQARVDWSVIPNTPDQVDQDAAKVASALLDWLHGHLKLSRKRMQIAMWLDICGTAFGYSNWDATKGQVRKFYYDPFTSQPINESQVQPQQKQWLDSMGLSEEKSDGDIEGDVLSPYDVVVPPRIADLDRMPWIMTRRTMSIEEVWNRWPDKAGSVPPSDPQIARFDQYRNRLPTLARRPALGIANVIDDDGAVDVDEFWYPPSKRMPSGLYAAGIRGHVLEYGPHKFAEAGLDTRFPVVDFHNIRVPGRFHSMSTVEHLIGPQQEYNRARQQVIQHRDTLSVAQWLSPIGALSKGLVRNEMGDVMEYNSRVGKPELIAPPPLGDAQLVSGQQAQADMQMISSFSEASLGNMPAGARSGNAVQMLQERDQMGIGPTVQELESSFEQWGTAMLKLLWKFQKYPRAVETYGSSRQSDVRYFKGSDLNGNCRVTVKAGSMTPKSKAATVEMMSTMVQLGVLNPADPKQHRLVLEALEVGGTDRLFLLMDGARRRARIENTMFEKPEPGAALPDVQVFDDHQVHYETHLEFMQTDSYELMDPMLKLAFQAHMQKHIIAVAQMMEAQAQVAGAAAAVNGGQPGGGGSPQAKPLGKASPPRQDSKPTASKP